MISAALMTATASTEQAGVLSLVVSMLPLVLVIVVMYFILIRPQKKKEKEEEDSVEKTITSPESVGANIDNLE